MQTGDLVFSFVGNEGNAISSVTEGYRGARVNHMGVVLQNRLGFFVLEAFPPEVRLTHMSVFRRRSNDATQNPRLMFGRLKEEHASLIPEAIAYGLQQRDIPYDRLYLTGESALYCSELVVDMFKVANSGTVFFPENPMSFRDSETGEVHPDWVSYYSYYGMPVPEGEPGSNPGDISLDPKVRIYQVDGRIPGYA